MHTIGFKAMKTLGMVQNAMNYAELGDLTLKQAFPCV